MPAKSIEQQRIFGIAYSIKNGESKLSDIEDLDFRKKIGDIVKRMSKKEIKDFAATKYDSLDNKMVENTGDIVIPAIYSYLKPESNKPIKKNKMVKMQNLIDYREFIKNK